MREKETQRVIKKRKEEREKREGKRERERDELSSLSGTLATFMLDHVILYTNHKMFHLVCFQNFFLCSLGCHLIIDSFFCLL